MAGGGGTLHPGCAVKEQVGGREEVCDCQKCDRHEAALRRDRNASGFRGFCDPVKADLSSQKQKEAAVTISWRSLVRLRPLSYPGASGLGGGEPAGVQRPGFPSELGMTCRVIWSPVSQTHW